MIYYRPTDGDVRHTPIKWRVRTSFIMTRLGEPVPPIVTQIRHDLKGILEGAKIDVIDADSVTTGRDFLLKIWEIAISVPIGIAIIYEGISEQTLANIFYELGWMQAFGKETIVIKAGNIKIPSDFVRTEYVEYDNSFERRFHNFLDSLNERVEYYETVAEQVDRNPLLAIDYLRRAYLLTGNNTIRENAKKIFNSAGLNERAKNSVEYLLIKF